jgi:hypothetical protein
MTAKPEDIPSDLTLEIGRNLSPEKFVTTVRAFFGYVKEVSETLAQGAAVEWTVEVKGGSALIGVAPTEYVPPEVVEAVYQKVVTGIEHVRNGDIDHSGLTEPALRHLRTLSEVSEGDKRRPVEMRVWVKRKPTAMSADIGRVITEDWRTEYSDFGTVEGRLETIQDKGTLLIYVRDLLFNSSVRCYFDEAMLPQVFDSFRRRVEITGTIHYRRNGTPTSIEAASIVQLPDDADLPSADDVRGILGAPT